MELKGRWVEFAIKDIYFPAAEIVLAALHGNDLIAGEVVDVSDGGANGSRYAVVRVERLEEPLVVPVGRLRDR